MLKNAVDRFWKCVNKTDGCWLWTGSLDGAGYGKLWVVNRRESAHRFSWMLHKVSIPKGLFVLHKCDVRNCVNPEHLFLGTAKDNTQDALSKNRLYLNSKVDRNIRNVWSKVNERDVLEIRGLMGKLTHKQIAKKFGISAVQVGSIIYRRAWRHI